VPQVRAWVSSDLVASVSRTSTRSDLRRAVIGLQGLSKAGLRYPIMPFGPQTEPGEGMAKRDAGKS
jgi:hypothetical protein